MNQPHQGDAIDAYWKRALALHRSLSDADRTILFEIMRQVTVDTVVNLFAILDGASALERPQEDFVLTSGSDNTKLNGNLRTCSWKLKSGIVNEAPVCHHYN